MKQPFLYVVHIYLKLEALKEPTMTQGTHEGHLAALDASFSVCVRMDNPRCVSTRSNICIKGSTPFLRMSFYFELRAPKGPHCMTGTHRLPKALLDAHSVSVCVWITGGLPCVNT
jgi:hypothetical protein